jgi:hypothetical protein
VRRIVVLGANGFFGHQAVRALSALGVRAVGASRRDGVDVEDRGSLRAFLRPGDVVLDAAGPFHVRTTALLDVALELGADVVDLSDSAVYASRIAAERARIEAATIAVLTGCSAISAVVATLVRASDIADPRSVDAWLAPASRDTAHVATARALIASIRPGPRRRCGFAPLSGFSVDSALRVQLPAIWPSLERAAFWVDPHTRGIGPLLALAARSRPLRTVLWLAAPAGVGLARMLGARDGIVAVLVRGPSEARWVLRSPRGSYRLAIAPAVLAARDLATGARPMRGLVPADRMVDAKALIAFVERLGVSVERV